MQDREPQVGREGRVRITQDDGTVIEGVLEMADNATIQGTPYNKATQLSDAVAQALKLTPVEGATVNDALGLLPGVLQDIIDLKLGQVIVSTGSYTGNGKNGRAISVGFTPKIVIIFTGDQFATSSGGYLTWNAHLLSVALESFSPNVYTQYPLQIENDGFVVGASYQSVHYIYNESGSIYNYIAIGQKFDNTVTISCKNSSGQLQDGCVVTLGENDPVVSNSTEPLVFKTVSQNPVLTVVSPIDYGGEVQTQTLDLSNTQNLSVDVTVDTSTHLTSGTITASVSGAFSSQVTSVDVFCLGGGGNGALSVGQTNSSQYAYVATGGAGGGGALKNSVSTADKIFQITVGGRASTSRITVDSTTICEATGGSNGRNNFESPSAPGAGTIGDSLMTGARPGYWTYRWDPSVNNYQVTSVAPQNGNVIDPFTSAQCSGAGGGRYEAYPYGPASGTATAVQGGGAYASSGSADGTVPGAGGGGFALGYYLYPPEPMPTAGKGIAGYVKWRVAQ